jgi:hypothetical protein
MVSSADAAGSVASDGSFVCAAPWRFWLDACVVFLRAAELARLRFAVGLRAIAIPNVAVLRELAKLSAVIPRGVAAREAPPELARTLSFKSVN